MSVTMTPADMVLTVVLGIVGSLATAALYKWLPQIATSFFLWCVEKSAKARDRKLVKLVAEYNEYEKLLGDHGRFLARAIYLFSICIILLMGTVLFFLTVAVIQIEVLRHALTPNFAMVHFRHYPPQQFVETAVITISLVGSLAALGCLIGFRFALFRYFNFVQPEENLERLDYAIARLSKRRVR